jgi:hypothetical protein
MSYGKELKEKRKLFCFYYIMLGNVYEAAVKAGFPESSALIDGLNTLENPSCRLKIRRLRSCLYQPASELVTTGLERLAFGSFNDAVSLCSDDFPSPHQLSQLDLFSISEIKKVKGGGIEIKFADRLKAMEKLLICEKENSEFSNAENLINALSFTSQEDNNED